MINSVQITELISHFNPIIDIGCDKKYYMYVNLGRFQTVYGAVSRITWRDKVTATPVLFYGSELEEAEILISKWDLFKRELKNALTLFM